MSRRRNDSEHPFDEDDSRDRAVNESQKPKRRRRWPWVLLVLGLFVFFLPNLIGWAGLQQRALDVGLADFNGKVSIEQVSLGWLQSVKLTNVTAVDANGNTLLEIPTVTSSKPLYAFLTAKDYGQLDLINPVLHLQLRPDGSNLEDAIAKYIEPADPKNSETDSSNQASLPKLSLNVVDGQAIVSSTVSTETWQIDSLNAVAQTSTETAPLIIDAQCRVTPTLIDQNGQTVLQSPGGLTITTQVDSGSPSLSFNSAELFLETQTLPLSLAAPVLQRFIGPAQTAGNLTGKFQVAFDAPSNSAAVDVQHLALDGFEIAAPNLMGSDQFTIENLSANGVLQLSPTTIAAQQFSLATDVGKLNADGTFDINQVVNFANSGQLFDTPFQMDGQFDVAKLIRMFPSTLQLHKDLVVNSGTVTFQAGNQAGNGVRRMVVNLDALNFNARRGNRDLVWAKPLRIVGTVSESEGQLAFENVSCQSDFLTISGSGNLQTASFVADGDLSKLMERVGQFVDLQDTQLAGVLKGKFGWKISDDGAPIARNGIENLPVQILGRFDIANPVIQLAGMPRWQQPKMSVNISANGINGATRTGNQLRLDEGGVQVDIGSEQVVVTLAQPIADAFSDQPWNTNCQVTGSMAGWLGHIENFVDLGEIAVGGQLALTCGAVMNANTIEFSNVEYEVQQLAFDGYGMKIREPKAIGAGAAVYDLMTGNTTIPDTTLSASSISARGQQLAISFPSNMQVNGNIVFRADINRVADWYGLSPTAESVRWYGAADGSVQLASNENGIGGRVNSTITDLVAGRQIQGSPAGQSAQTIQVSQSQGQWQEIWREPKVGVVGDFSLANDFNAVGFQNAVIDSPSFKANANGSISDLANSMVADISGTWSPSWDKINSLLQAYSGNMLRFAGTGEHQFMLRGPLFETPTQPGQLTPWVSPQLQAATSFGWERGEILGLPVGKSQMELNLHQSVAVVKTNGVPFGGGVIQFAPQIDLRGQQPLLRMDSTRIIDNVVLQPETARQWLKYVAPLAADATSAQGRFTVDISQAQVPIFDPMKMDVQGSVQLSDVVIGAGPTAQQLLGTIKQLRTLLKPESSDRDLNTWLQMAEQTVPVVVKNGRVYHERLKLAHKDLVIQTSGSVGFDQSLDMVAKIPIADDWIAGKPYLASLRGQSVSIPISGTATKPRLDQRGLQQLSANLVKQAASGAINQAIGEKLTPKVNQFQDQLNNKFNNEINKLQGKFGETLGDALNPNAAPSQPAGANGQPSNSSPTDELIKGIGNLFGK